MNSDRFARLILPVLGVLCAGLLWSGASALVADLPSPLETWQEGKLYILEPFAKRGEMDQGIGRLAYYSLVRVARGFLLGIALATPLGLLLGVSTWLHRMFDPVMQVLRPISPLAWLPLGLVLFQKSEPAALFAIAICSMWPTVINTMVGVRAIPEDFWNVGGFLWQEYNSLIYAHILLAILTIGIVGYGLDRLMAMAESRLRII
jgi:nitrate/nitrite transport system permease protein